MSMAEYNKTGEKDTMNKYDDIINLQHFEPKNHKRMSMENRAAQFAPFAALTGHEEAIAEAARSSTTPPQ